MTARDIVMSAAGNSGDSKTYIEDVFSTYLYTGNGATQTINNGIDLAGKGGMVWIKGRSSATYNKVVDTVRGAGANKALHTNTTESGSGECDLTAFTSSGFSLTHASGSMNNSGIDFASWTFRKAPKFFDVVTYTGDGTTNGSKTINHSLGTTPGMIIIKTYANTGSGNWVVWHRSSTGAGFLNLTNAFSGSVSDYVLNVNASTFSVSDNGPGTNNNNSSYVAYLFAHDTTADGLIQCGSFTKDGSGNATITLGWEPQYVLVKSTNGSGSSVGDTWLIADTMRGASETLTPYLEANASIAEQTNGGAWCVPTATGFKIQGLSGGSNHIYMAIRRGPMRTPTDGTKVFSPVTSSATTGTIASGFVTDMVMALDRTSGTSPYNREVFSRLIGNCVGLSTASTSSEINNGSTVTFQQNNGITLNAGSVYANGYVYQQFKRAPGFFDVVCYTGTGSDRTVNHNLGVAPELMIFKIRSSADSWQVYCNALSASGSSYLLLNDTAVAQTNGSTRFTGAPTSTQINLSTNGSVNSSGQTYVAYLFASCPGVSKVGSYTGNGTSQTINCGFSGGARFVLIKRTNSTGDWYVWDTARGIVAGNDPHLSLNTTAAEVTSNDTIDPDSTGFIVNQVDATNVNVSGASYIYLAIA